MTYGLLVEEYQREQDTCSRCGNPRGLCSDAEKVWYPQRSICHAEMEAVAANRRYDALHEERPFHDGTFRNWNDKATPFTPYRYDDGVSVWVAPVDLNPDDNFLSNGEVVPSGDTS